MLRALEVARLGDAVAQAIAPAAASAPSTSRELVRRPDVEAALLALGVGVQRRGEAALRAAHLAQHLVERLLADRAR